MRGGHAFIMAAFLTLALAPAAAAGAAKERPGDAQAARPLIAEQCVKCHVVPGFPEEKVEPAVQAPTFGAIANDAEKYSDEALRKFLRKPHYPMQGFIMSKRDIENIIAFVHELRRR